eukprot:m.352223 g.352223  ORF g.352223 m.352223 type:complete len:71 (+) comp16466_c0_seq1:1794-2006(+)
MPMTHLLPQATRLTKQLVVQALCFDSIVTCNYLTWKYAKMFAHTDTQTTVAFFDSIIFLNYYEALFFVFC